MNELDYQEAYDTLVEILNNNGLGWVASQVDEHIRIGKTIQKEIETLKEDRYPQLFSDDVYQSRFRKGARDTFPVVEEYQPRERLELLVDAIEKVVLDTAQIESEVLDYVGKNWNNWEGFQFFTDEPGTEPRRLTSDISKSRLEYSRNLGQFLDAVRKEVSS